MTFHSLSMAQDWERFNSSLLIEVTRPTGIFTCTGVAVSTKVIITAAHCLEGEIDNVRVFNQSVYDSKAPSMPVSKFELHPNYNLNVSRYRSDLGKIIMKHKLPAYINIHPIQLVNAGDIIYGNIYRFGFGQRNYKNIRTIITPGLRRLNFQEDVLELNDEFSRSGDSGGPIFIQNGTDVKILAIHSTFSTGPEGNYSLNPLLGTHMSWIFSH